MKLEGQSAAVATVRDITGTAELHVNQQMTVTTIRQVVTAGCLLVLCTSTLAGDPSRQSQLERYVVIALEHHQTAAASRMLRSLQPSGVHRLLHQCVITGNAGSLAILLAHGPSTLQPTQHARWAAARDLMSHAVRCAACLGGTKWHPEQRKSECPDLRLMNKTRGAYTRVALLLHRLTPPEAAGRATHALVQVAPRQPYTASQRFGGQAIVRGGGADLWRLLHCVSIGQGVVDWVDPATGNNAVLSAVSELAGVEELWTRHLVAALPGRLVAPRDVHPFYMRAVLRLIRWLDNRGCSALMMPLVMRSCRCIDHAL